MAGKGAICKQLPAFPGEGPSGTAATRAPVLPHSWPGARRWTTSDTLEPRLSSKGALNPTGLRSVADKDVTAPRGRRQGPCHPTPSPPHTVTSRMAADMPSETELFTRAKQFLKAACRSSRRISPISRTPAALKPEQEGLRPGAAGRDPVGDAVG